MKKTIKICLLVLFVTVIRINSVKADYFYEDNWISGIYANLKEGDFSKPQLMRFIRRKSDNKATYCISPRVRLYEDEVYTKSTNINLSNYQLNRIEKLAYYGYGYKNHTTNKWYAITQFMIWKTVEPNMDIFFTDKFDGNRVVKYTDEINELENLVKNSDILPSIEVPDLLPESTISVEDKNNVLKEYEVEKANDINANINNNKLNIETKMEGKYTLNLNKKYNLYSDYSTYFKASKGQNLLLPGNLKTLNYKIDINVINGKLTVKKTDSETKEPLENVVFELYDKNNSLLSTKATDLSGEALFDRLLYDKYYIKEKEAKDGYKIDLEMHEVDINSDNQEIELTNEKIKEKKIIKTEQKEETPLEIKKEEISLDNKEEIPILNIKNDIPDNPKTSDIKVYIFIILSYSSFIGILYLLSYLKRKN